MAAGLGGILVSVCSAFAKFLDLPSLSEKAVAGLGIALVVVGGLKVHSSNPARPAETGEVTEGPSISIDLPLPHRRTQWHASHYCVRSTG